MTERITADNHESGEPTGSPRPRRTLEDWQLQAADWERARDYNRALLERAGQDPTQSAAFNHLLGKLSVAHDEIIRHQTEALEGQFKDNIDKT